MNNSRTSLIQKFLSRGFTLTPFEIIHLKYLSEKGILEKLTNDEQRLNPYLKIKNQEGVLSFFYLDILTERAKRNYPDLYHSCNYAYKNIQYQDDYIVGEGYKGLALLTQLKSMKSEYLAELEFNIDMEENEFELIKKLENNLLSSIGDFYSYSFVHQKKVLFAEVIEDLRVTFKNLIVGINNILMLNFFLNKMIDLDDLECLGFLKMWASKKEGIKSFIDEKFINDVIKKNHIDYTEVISSTIRNMPNSFSANSLIYVENTIAKTISF